MRRAIARLLVLGLCIPLAACTAVPRSSLSQDWSSNSDYEDYGDYGYSGEGAGKTWAKEGTYAGFALHYSIDDFDVAPGASVDNGIGGGLRIGHRANEWFAVELTADQAEYDLTARTPFGTATGELDMMNVALQGKVFLAQGGVQPYFLFGIGWTHVSLEGETDNGVLTRIGVGADFPLSPRVALFAEGAWNSVSMDTFVDLDNAAFQLGVLFRF